MKITITHIVLRVKLFLKNGSQMSIFKWLSSLPHPPLQPATQSINLYLWNKVPLLKVSHVGRDNLTEPWRCKINEIQCLSLCSKLYKIFSILKFYIIWIEILNWSIWGGFYSNDYFILGCYISFSSLWVCLGF